MILKRLLVVLVSAALFAIPALSQNKIVTGKVTDSKNGSALQSVTVRVTNTDVATQTDAAGNFTFSVPASATSLTVASEGYATQTVHIGNGTVSVSLVSTTTALGDVVVVAYGTRKKTDLTGSVTAVSAKDFQQGAIASPEQLIQGKVPGLQMVSGGGSAGGGSTIRIRTGASLNASNDPLIVIDGLPVEGNQINNGGNLLNTINANDIESISILKDASATALYGSRASNGVIIVTTKKGTKGKIKFNFNTQLSFGAVTKYVPVLTTSQFRSIVQENGTAAQIALMGNASTDWQQQIYQTAGGVNTNISASGAIANVLPFRLSYGNTYQNGVLLTDRFTRNTVDLNLSPKFLKDHLSVNINSKFSNTGYHHADQGAVNAAALFDPTQPIHQTNKFGGYYEWLTAGGSPVGNNGNAGNPNPLSLLKFRNNHETVNRFIGNIQLDYKLHWLPDLHVQVNAGMDYAYQNGTDHYDSLIVTQFVTRGRNNPYKQDKKDQLLETNLFYTKSLPSIKSNFDVLVGHSYQNFETNVYNYANYYLNGDTIPNTTPTFLTDKPTFRIESYYARLNYTLNNKYLLTASLRRDASSKFSSSNRIGYFPAFALAWKLKEEFFKNNSKINELKLRAGWGETGQQDGIGNYDYLVRYSTSTNGALYYLNGQWYSFYRPSSFNPGLKWESTATSNIGLDFGFFNNRITGNLDFYYKKTKDLLSPMQQAPGQNFDIQINGNIGQMENKGVELAVNTVPVRNKNFEWNLGFNATYQTRKITKLYAVLDPSFTGVEVGGIDGATANKLDRHQVGYAPFKFYAYKQIYNQTTGMPIEGMYYDFNHDGAADYYYNDHNSFPSVLYGFNTQLNYKKWYIGIAAHGAADNFLYNNFASNNGVLNSVLNGNVLSNASGSYLKTGFRNKQSYSDYYIENADFFRLDNINIGYNVGKIFNNKATMRLAASVQNAFVITKYSGMDPENAANASGDGIDHTIYPRPLVSSITVNIDF